MSPSCSRGSRKRFAGGLTFRATAGLVLKDLNVPASLGLGGILPLLCRDMRRLRRGVAPWHSTAHSFRTVTPRPIVAVLQSVVQKLGKPWYRRRAAGLPRRHQPFGYAEPVARNRAGARAIALSDPAGLAEAAASPWVSKEVAYWLEQKGADRAPRRRARAGLQCWRFPPA